MDHASLTVNITINKEFIQDKWRTIIKNNEEKKFFVNDFRNSIYNINISDRELLEKMVQEYAIILESIE